MSASSRARASACSSFHSPMSWGVIRPSAVTAEASTITAAAPETASAPRCCQCQGWATPSRALYWHMGATTTRLERARPPSRIGENRVLTGGRSRGRHALLHQQRLQLAGGEHLAHDVGPADELALDVELGDGRPVREALDALAQGLVLEDVDPNEIHPEVVENLDHHGGETALRVVGDA